jgi:hypothetical protein
MTLDCVLFKDSNQTLVAGLGSEINSQACLCVLQRPHHNTICWLSTQHVILVLVAMVTDLCGVVPYVTGSSEWNLLHVSLLVPAFLRQLIGFWKNLCIPVV